MKYVSRVFRVLAFGFLLCLTRVPVKADDGGATNLVCCSQIPNRLSATNDTLVIARSLELQDFRIRQNPLVLQERPSIDLAGHSFRITQGQPPLNMDPMQSSMDKERQLEMYRRVDLVGGGSGLFYSEAEGAGFHVPSISPDAAFFLQIADNKGGFNIGFRFSSSFDSFPFDSLLSDR